MHILIIGGGYLSTVLSDCFQKDDHTVTVVDVPAIDITKLQSVQEVIARHQPDLIVNTAGFTNTNAAEQPENRDTAFAINVHGPLNVLYAAQDIPWVHFSTAMLFDGPTPRLETDLPHPTGYYAWTKAWSDASLAPFAETRHGYIFRIHTPISRLSHPRNFINRLQQFDQLVDIPTSVTVVEDMYLALKKLLQQKAPGGLYHMVNPSTISAFAIGKEMQKHGLIPQEKNLIPLSRDLLQEMTVARQGAHQTFPVLATEKLQREGIELPDIQVALTRTLENFSA